MKAVQATTSDVRGKAVCLNVEMATVSTLNKIRETSLYTVSSMPGADAKGVYTSLGLVAGVLILSVGLGVTCSRFGTSVRSGVKGGDAGMQIRGCHELNGIRLLTISSRPFASYG
jgi:hypothetical protein